jgi:hypothetical protein
LNDAEPGDARRVEGVGAVHGDAALHGELAIALSVEVLEDGRVTQRLRVMHDVVPF